MTIFLLYILKTHMHIYTYIHTHVHTHEHTHNSTEFWKTQPPKSYKQANDQQFTVSSYLRLLRYLLVLFILTLCAQKTKQKKFTCLLVFFSSCYHVKKKKKKISYNTYNNYVSCWCCHVKKLLTYRFLQMIFICY